MFQNFFEELPDQNQGSSKIFFLRIFFWFQVNNCGLLIIIFLKDFQINERGLIFF